MIVNKQNFLLALYYDTCYTVSIQQQQQSDAHMQNDTLTNAQQQHMLAMQQVAAQLTAAYKLLSSIDSHVASVALTQLDDLRITVGGPCNEYYYEDSEHTDY